MLTLTLRSSRPCAQGGSVGLFAAMRGASVCGLLLTLIACGSRSEVDVMQAAGSAGVVPFFDAGRGLGTQQDAGGIRTRDAGSRVDASVRNDAATSVVPPPPRCVAGKSTVVDLLSRDNQLYRFDTATRLLERIGAVSCPSQSSPYSMAVDASGTAYAVYASGELFRVSTTDARCSATTFVSGQGGLQTFGMAFVTSGNEDQLFVCGAGGSSQGSSTLARIDTQTLMLSPLGRFSSSTGLCELAGTDDSRLFAFCLEANGGSTLRQLDMATARVLSSDALRVGESQAAFAVAFQAGSFWIFTTAELGTQVTQYDPSSKLETQIVTLDPAIVGAGARSCALP